MNTYPIFRLAIALAAGILFAETWKIEGGVGLILALLVLLLGLGMCLKSPSYAGRWVFGAGVSGFMFLVGMLLTAHAWKEVTVAWNPEKQMYQGVLMEPPIEKAKTFQCRVGVAGKEVLLYLPKDSLSAALKTGDGLSFYTRMDAPENQEEFQQFDYARFLYHDGISGTAYVPSDAWKMTDHKGVRDWKLKALSLREWLIDKYRQWGIGEKQLPVLSALTLGYKGDLDKETRNAYSVAGISHVLALSGLHIGIFWMLLNGLLKPLSIGRLKWLKGGVVVLLLWAFAFLVGLEASVVRAVVMCMLFELGRLSGTKALSLNTLSIAAFFMLLYQPFYLFDVGFQLSFVAVASILLFYPLLVGCWSIKHPVWRWIWKIVSVSVAAQVGTAPLVMYYFSNFSVYFLLANIVAAVLVPLIIYVAVGMVLMFPFPAFQWYVARFLDGLVSVLNGMAGWTGGLPYASVSVSVMHPLEVGMCYVVLMLGWLYGVKRRRKWLIRTLAACACLLGLHLYILLTA